MSWARLDDRANEHRKQLRAGAEACWLWACGLMYANRQRERDGFIPDEALLILYPFKNPKALADKLVAVGLWERVDGGYQIHDFEDWNQSREERERELEAARERMRRVRAERKANIPPNVRERSGEHLPNVPEHKANRPPNVRGEHPPKFAESSGSTPTPTPDIQNTTTTTTQRPVSSKLATAGPVVVAAVAADSVAERARRVLENPYDGQFLRPSTWPEVQRVAEAWSFGVRLKLRDTVTNDTDLRAVLEALADGYSVDELVLAGERAKTSPHFAKLRRKAPAAFTAAVLRTLLAGENAAPAASPYEDTGEAERLLAASYEGGE